MWGLVSSVFKKIIPNNTTTTFQKVGWYFVDGIWISYGTALTITKMIDFYSQCIFTFLFATVFNWNELKRHLITKLIQPQWNILRVIFP